MGKPMHMLKVHKNRPNTRSPHGIIGGLLASRHSPFLPSYPHPELLHLQYLNMCRASVLAGAHHVVASNNTFNTANVVSGMVIM